MGEKNIWSPAVNQQRIVTPGENGMPGHSIPNPSGAEAIVSDL